jgi:cupin superfamily acireductone dioxygenase involved in methionine salvage
MIKFKLNGKENELAEKFLQEHRHPEIYKGAIGGHIDFIFTPTSIGDTCIIRCDICDKKENITDYDAW